MQHSGNNFSSSALSSFAMRIDAPAHSRRKCRRRRGALCRSESFAALQLVGPDASTFLQGYLTCDMTTLEPSRALLGAYCNIKGRVVADATVLLTRTSVRSSIHGSLRDAVTSSLRKYLAFSRSKFAAGGTGADSARHRRARRSGAAAAPLTVSPFRGG